MKPFIKDHLGTDHTLRGDHGSDESGPPFSFTFLTNRTRLCATAMCVAPAFIIPSTELSTPRTAATSHPFSSRAEGSA